MTQKNWRPEGWQAAVGKAVKERFELEGRSDWIFYAEAGADAMLESLRTRANKQFSEWIQKEGVEKFGFDVTPGTWVFIPDSEQESTK